MKCVDALHIYNSRDYANLIPQHALSRLSARAGPAAVGGPVEDARALWVAFRDVGDGAPGGLEGVVNCVVEVLGRRRRRRETCTLSRARCLIEFIEFIELIKLSKQLRCAGHSGPQGLGRSVASCCRSRGASRACGCTLVRPAGRRRRGATRAGGGGGWSG